MRDKLKMGMVGGGNGGNIGNSHRRGAAMDNLAVLTAGSFTRNSRQNKKDGMFWGVAEERIYDSYQEMAKKESKRPDGIDFVSIVTPNHTHYPIARCFLEHGIHVVCEKPMTLQVSEAEELAALAKEKNLEICVPYTYAHYPAIRECRSLIEEGKIGKILDVVAEYPQDWMILGLQNDEDDFTKWIGDPKYSGASNVTGAMGVHLYYLICAATGLRIEKVLADFGYYPEDAKLETISRILMAFDNGAHGMAWTSNVAIGHDCSMYLKIYGEKGSIEWSHDDMTHLYVSYLDQPVQIFSANRSYMSDFSKRASRLPAGHPEGFYEAYANMYHSFCEKLLDRMNGCLKEECYYYFPHAFDGLAGVKYVQAAVDSQRKGNVWVALDDAAKCFL